MAEQEKEVTVTMPWDLTDEQKKFLREKFKADIINTRPDVDVVGADPITVQLEFVVAKPPPAKK
jgi:hypothetical protein